MSTESHNRMQWDGRSSRHVEAWALSFVHRSSRTGFWIRYGLDVPAPRLGRPSLRVWFASFDADRPRASVALNRGAVIDTLSAAGEPWQVDFGAGRFAHEACSGVVAGGRHSARWDLRYEPALHPHLYLPRRVYAAELPPAMIVAPNPTIYLDGEVEVDGRVFTLDAEPGCQTHLWGSAYLPAWALAHCSSFREDTTASLQVLALRTHRGWLGNLVPRVVLVALYLGGEVYDFCTLRSLLLTRGSWSTGSLRFRSVGHHVKLEGELQARPEDFVRAELQDPDGAPVFCHATALADAVVTLWTRRSRMGHFRRLCRLTSRSSAHLEHGGPAPDHAVDRRHEAVDRRDGSGRAHGAV